MLSNVLQSDRVVQASIVIVGAFVRLREMLVAHADLARKFDELEKRYDKNFAAVFDAIRTLMTPSDPKRKRIGFDTD